MTWQQIGLWSFILTAGTTILVLGFDWWLSLNRYPMITDYCRRNPPLAWLILMALEFGVIGLAIHFMRPIKL